MTLTISSSIIYGLAGEGQHGVTTRTEILLSLPNASGFIASEWNNEEVLAEGKCEGTRVGSSHKPRLLFG